MEEPDEFAVSDEYLEDGEQHHIIASPEHSFGWAQTVRSALPTLRLGIPSLARQRVFDYGSFSSNLVESTPILSPDSSIRPELGDAFEADELNHDRTAEIAANSPRYRRRSSTFIDGVHDLTDEGGDGKHSMAPAQLYSTMSGRLFHSGRIAIVLVGPPARGKT